MVLIKLRDTDGLPLHWNQCSVFHCSWPTQGSPKVVFLTDGENHLGKCLQTSQRQSAGRGLTICLMEIYDNYGKEKLWDCATMPGAKCQSSPAKMAGRALNGRVPGRQRQPSTAQVTESVITHAGDSLATPNPNILLASQGVQAWNNSRALRTYKSKRAYQEGNKISDLPVFCSLNKSGLLKISS